MASKRVLPVIVLAQVFCTAPWFGGNAVLPELTARLHLPATANGSMGVAVQLGFIAGTLVFAVLALADRWKATHLFCACALAAALVNGAIPFCDSYAAILVLRGITGFLLAGIYPVGMKIAAEQFPEGLGRALGWLVGALVLGTALPHGLRALLAGSDPRQVLWLLSAATTAGGLLMLLLVPARAPVASRAPAGFGAAFGVFRQPALRQAAFGYFGHMWELYAFWTFVPRILARFAEAHALTAFPASGWAFAVIAAGAAGCVAAGWISLRKGARLPARMALLGSLGCCLTAPVFFQLPAAIALPFFLLWGVLVVADSPMFSTLVAQSVPAQNKGAALTLVTSIGFAVTAVSIALLTRCWELIDTRWLPLLLAPGPLFGLLALGRRAK